MITYLTWFGVYLLVGLVLIIASYQRKGDIYVKDIFDIICLTILWPIILILALEDAFAALGEKFSDFWDKIKDKKISGEWFNLNENDIKIIYLSYILYLPLYSLDFIKNGNLSIKESDLSKFEYFFTDYSY
jgi:hypothetical protein